MDVEVYPYDLTSAAGRKAGELLGSWRPQPGELDDADRVITRLHALRTVAGYSRAPGDRSAAGFLTRTSERDIAMARAMSGNAGGPVYDEHYEYEVGEVLLFDAEVDKDRLTVDWATAVPHPSTDPGTLSWEGQVQRVDGVVVDPQACRSGVHRVEVSGDGTVWPFNEAGQIVAGLGDQEKADYAEADRSQVPHRGPLLVTISFGNGDGGDAKLRAEPAESALRRGTVGVPAPGEGVSFRAADLEALRLAAGSQHSRITDASGATVSAVYLVEADYGAQMANGSVVFDALGATSAVDRDPSIGSLSVAEVAGDLRVSTSGSRWVKSAPARGSAFLGGTASKSAAAEKGSVGYPSEQESTAAGPVAEAASLPGRDGLGKGIGSLLDRRSPSKSPSKRGGLKALVAMQSRTVALMREHGPTLVEATKSKLKDPAVQAALKKAMLTAVEVGLAGKGGAPSTKFARAADTAMRVGDMVATAQKNQHAAGARSSGLSR
ncbi:hypothetical protein [Rhodococcus sp. NCIMB 12038]|uniref:hypothetical protein n=1 Tax=Rhodococcus sp. NCIMB 12038 TaxID=933800 RepID=UPI000B3D33CE|nr:hypothetical protein [Rhodococcus sp. NCIMB 12038]OUS97229.1 hypothetical protein CA951_02470 [Rhodococcus sp. NCIMB 12038]